MVATVWKRHQLLLALALAVFCAVALTAASVSEVHAERSSSVLSSTRSLRATASEASSAPTPAKTKKPNKKAPTATKKPAKKETPKGKKTPPVAGGAVIGNEANTTAMAKKGGKCVTGDPTSGYISKADVDWIWEKRMKPGYAEFKNFIFDQLMRNNGKLSYCIRWDSTNKLSKATASKFKAMLDKQYAQWNKWLVGYGCWPFAKIELEMVGVAVRNKAQLDWTDNSLGPIYAGVLDGDGIPQCPTECYKHRDFAASADTSKCTGKPFDISLWPTLGQGGGAGGDWGQRVDEAHVLSTLDTPSSEITAHEIGHGFGLPDFYEPGDKPRENMAKMVMQAGASSSVTEADGWLIRRGWEHVRMRYPSTKG